MRKALDRVWGEWCRFWFETPAPSSLRLFRISFAALLFFFYAIRSLDLELLFADSGILPRAIVGDVMPAGSMRFRPSVLDAVGSVGGVWAVHLVFLTSLGSLAFGVLPRISSLLALVLHVSFIHRNMASVFGIDLISTFFLLYLCLAEWGEELACAARRLCQLQVCIIYAYSGWEKLKGASWWRGEAIWDVLANSQLARWDFSFMAHLPLLIVAATYATLAWEVYFPVLVWNSKLRNALLVGGVFLHFGIGLAVSIPFFGALMVVCYASFLDEKTAKTLIAALRRKIFTPGS